MWMCNVRSPNKRIGIAAALLSLTIVACADSQSDLHSDCQPTDEHLSQYTTIIHDAAGTEISTVQGIVNDINADTQRFTIHNFSEEACDDVYALYDFSGEEIISFPTGHKIEDFLSDGRMIAVSSQSPGFLNIRKKHRVTTYDTEGRKLAEIPGQFESSNSTEERIFTWEFNRFSKKTIRMYDFEGNITATDETITYLWPTDTDQKNTDKE